MADTSAANTNTNAGPIVSGDLAQTGLATIPAFNQMITVKLSGDNFLLWMTQLFPYLRSQRLIGYINDTVARPVSSIS